MKLKLTPEQFLSIWHIGKSTYRTIPVTSTITLTSEQVKEIVAESGVTQAYEVCMPNTCPVNHTDHEEPKPCEHEWVGYWTAQGCVERCNKCNAFSGNRYPYNKHKTRRMAPAIAQWKSDGRYYKTSNLFENEQAARNECGDVFIQWPAQCNGQPMWFDVPDEEENK